MKTVREAQVLELSFPMDYQPPYWKVKPGCFIAHFLAHEGPGSLHSFLKDNGWITSLGAGVNDDARGITVFKVTPYLTREGLRKFILLSNTRTTLVLTLKLIQDITAMSCWLASVI